MDSNAKLVDAPTLWPTKCGLCPSQKGPMLDTAVEYPSPGNVGRIYVCRTCAKQISTIYGFAKGKEMERLEHAAENLEALEKEVSYRDTMINDLIKQVEEQRKTLTAQEAVIESKEGQLSGLRNIVSQFEHLGSQIGQMASSI